MKNLKQQILHSDLIVELIKTRQVLAIYLGGSRLNNLDSPESDYDIIVITSNEELCNHDKKIIPLNIRAHIFIAPITRMISLIKHSSSYTNIKDARNLLETILLQEEEFIYLTKRFKNFRDTLLKYRDTIIKLSLEKIVYSLYTQIAFPITKYYKKYYHFLTYYYMLENFKSLNSYLLSEEQVENVLHIKENSIISNEFLSCLDSYNILSNTFMFTNCDHIYKEVQKYE